MPKKKKVAKKSTDGDYKRLQAVLEAIPGYVSWVSSDLKYLGVNKNLADSLQINPKDIIGKDVGFQSNDHFFSKRHLLLLNNLLNHLNSPISDGAQVEDFIYQDMIFTGLIPDNTWKTPPNRRKSVHPLNSNKAYPLLCSAASQGLA